MIEDRPLTLDDLCATTGLTIRTVRYYIQLGLMDRPEGAGRGAHYGRRHLDQLLLIQACQRKGLSLEAIREFVHRPDEEAREAPRPRAPGTVEVWSRLMVADGVELDIEAGRARPSALIRTDPPFAQEIDPAS